MQNNILKPHIVILGAGFGGTYVAKKLAKYVKSGLIDITIVNKTNYFLFTPLLHEVATGSLSPRSVTEPLREIFVNTGINLCQGSIDTIDTENKRVHIIGNGEKHTLAYDFSVLATGSETNYFNTAGAEKYALPIKTLNDAVKIRSKIIDAFEEAIFCEDPEERRRLLSFTVVGGGPTGVETVAELHEFISGMVDRYYCNQDDTSPIDENGLMIGACKKNEVTINLIHKGDRLLQQMSVEASKNAFDRLNEKGIKILLSTGVSSVGMRDIVLEGGTKIPSNLTIWSAGVKSYIPNLTDNSHWPIDKGRIMVDGNLRVIDNQYIFAIGDVAVNIGEPVPMLAQAAVQQANIVATNIIRSIKSKALKTFKYYSKGTMVSVGQWFAIGDIFSLKLSGKFTWFMWRTVYFFKFASWRKRLQIAFEWTIALCYPRDITKLN